MPTVPSLNQDSQTAASEKKLSMPVLLKRHGDSGTDRAAGTFFEEYASDWRDEKRIKNVEEMRRGDGAVKGVLRAIKSPLLGTTWSVVTEDDSPKGEKIREFVEQNLFGMRRTWKDFLREATGYLDFGFYCFELIWEKRDGRVWLADLEPRIPSSIFRWKLQDGSFGIVQLLTSDEVRSHMAEVPASKLLILTNDKEGDDVTGQSVLRAAYKHWYIKNNLYKIASIAAERYGVGIPVFKLPASAGDAEKEKAEEMARNMRSNEAAYAIFFEGWEFDIKTPNGNPQGAAIESQINHHNAQIMLSVLATFLALGSEGGGGSYALSQDQSSFFLNVCRDNAAYFREQVDKQVIKRLVDLNFGPQEKYPVVQHTPLGDIDYQEFSTVLSTLSAANLIDVDPKLKQFIHTVFNLPKISQERLDMMEEQSVEADLAKLEGGDVADPSMEVPDDEMEIPEDDEMDDEDMADEETE